MRLPEQIGSPLVIAHRGGAADQPEHTLGAYRRAIEIGADGLECDVRLTRDGHLVCIHDGRLDRTSDGTGRVSASTLDDLRQLDFASWFTGHEFTGHEFTGHEFTGHAGNGGDAAGVLTLETLLELAVDAGRPLRLLIETKHPSRFGAAVEQGVADLLHRFGLAGDRATAVTAVVMSFSPLALRRLRALAPKVATAFLFDLPVPSARDGRAPYGASVLGPSVRALAARPDLVGLAHRRGLQVYVWTANRDLDVDLAARAGVDAIITDRPAAVLARLGR